MGFDSRVSRCKCDPVEKVFPQDRFDRGRLTVCTYASELDEETRQHELPRLLLRDVRSSEGSLLTSGIRSP